jgi:tRNA uridine 5-carbamoylmethylation protein Kti12
MTTANGNTRNNHDKVCNTNNVSSSSSCGDNRTAVILLAGLPASGKSSLAQKLQKRFDYHNNNNTCTKDDCHRRRLIHIEYDVLEEDLLLFSSTEEDEKISNDDDAFWKNRRRDAWNQARQIAIEQMEKGIQTVINDDSSSRRNTSTVILMDDNFHLRGMRKHIHRSLLKYHQQQPSSMNMNLRFGTLYIKTPINTCLERNRIRSGRRRVPDDVIIKMDASFEPPRTAWEVDSSMTINYNNNVNNNNNNCVSSEHDDDNDDEFFTTETINKIMKFIIEDCPIIIDTAESEAENLEQSIADRTKTLENQIHNLDKLLRSYVGKVAKFNNSYAGAANAGRKQLMKDFKAGHHCRSLLLIADDEVDNDNDNDNEGTTSSIDYSRLVDTFLDFVVPVVDTTTTDVNVNTSTNETTNNNGKHGNNTIRSQLKDTLLKDLLVSH